MAEADSTTALMLKADLANTGIPYADDAGHVADFHSPRHSFISRLAAGGVHPKLAQTLARHSDINLTMSRYTHTALSDEADALSALPSLPSPFDGSEQNRQDLQPTGTDGSGNSVPLCVPELSSFGAVNPFIATHHTPMRTRRAVMRLNLKNKRLCGGTCLFS